MSHMRKLAAAHGETGNGDRARFQRGGRGPGKGEDQH